MKRILFLGAFLSLFWACSESDKQIQDSGDGFVATETSQNESKVKSEETNIIGGTAEVLHIDAAEFKAKVFNFETQTKWAFAGKRPCVVDFYADWCGPCKRLSPIMDELAIEYAGKIDFYKVDIDKNPEIAQVFQVSSIPALLFCPQKEQPQMNAGLIGKEDLVKIINEFILK